MCSQVNVIIFLIFEDFAFAGVFYYFLEHSFILYHQVSYVWHQCILCIGISHDKNESTNNAGEVDSWRIVFPN